MPRPKCTYKCPLCPCCYWSREGVGVPPQYKQHRQIDNAAYKVCVCVCACMYLQGTHIDTHTHTDEHLNRLRLHCAICLPIVDINVDVKASSEKRKSIQVFPTPESPISKSLKSKSYVFFAISSYGTRTDVHALTHTHSDNPHTEFVFTHTHYSRTRTLWFDRTKQTKIHRISTHTLTQAQ